MTSSTGANRAPVDVASQIPGAGMAWAPEAYWDDVNKQYMVYWATASDADNKSGDRTNMYYSTTRDFVNFTTPVKWIDRVKSVIDTTMIKADDGYYYRVSGDTYLGVERSRIRMPQRSPLVTQLRMVTTTLTVIRTSGRLSVHSVT